jgi:hypothetical protein
MHWLVRYERGFFWLIGFVEIALSLWHLSLYLTGHSYGERRACRVSR